MHSHSAGRATKRWKEGEGEMVSAAGFEPTAPGFMPLRLSPPPFSVRGLDCPFAIGPKKAVRRRPSSLYTFPVAGAWLGIGKAQDGAPAFPDFERFRYAVSARNAQLNQP